MRPIRLASGTLPEFDPVTVVEAAAAAGFDGSGIWFDPKSWREATTRATARAFADTGIRPVEIEVLIVGDPARSTNHQRLLEAGAALGASDAIVVSTESDPGRCADLLGALNEQARPLGVRLCLEFLPIFAISDLATARSVVEAVGDANLKILVDTLHVARTGTAVEDLAALPPELLSFAQFCDAPRTAPGAGDYDELYDEALNGRLLPGDGELPLVELVAALPPGLPLSLEMRARWLREDYPDPVERARAVMRGMQTWLAEHGESTPG
jgi:sugar phosphate isomerase/epimerase